MFSVLSHSFSLCVTNDTLQSVSRVTAASGYTAQSNGEKTKCCQKRVKGSLSGLVFLYQSPKPQIRVHDYSSLTLPHIAGPLSVA